MTPGGIEKINTQFPGSESVLPLVVAFFPAIVPDTLEADEVAWAIFNKMNFHNNRIQGALNHKSDLIKRVLVGYYGLRGAIDFARMGPNLWNATKECISLSRRR